MDKPSSQTSNYSQLEKLSDDLKKLELSLEGSGFGAWEVNLADGKLKWDDQMHRVFGFVPGMFSGQVDHWNSMIHSEDKKIVDREFEKLLKGERVNLFTYRAHKGASREVIHIEANGVAQYDSDGNIVKIIGLNRDITDRVIEEKKRESEKLTLMANMKLATFGELAASVAHEINNPLTILDGLSASLRRYMTQVEVPADASERIQDKLTKIEMTTNRIAKIVKSLLKVARQSDKDERSPTLAQEIFSDIANIMGENLKRANINITFDDQTNGIPFNAKGYQISQVLLNLAKNSLDALESLKETWIKITATLINDGKYIEFRVQDSGPRISDDLANQIMEPFFTTKSIGKGTGLGLSLSQKIIQEHGGILFLDPECETMCFVIQLPRTSPVG